MAKHNRWFFTVQGRGSFPLDMLRHDCCWPADSEAIGNMDTEERLLRNVRLVGVRQPNRERWRSFQWPVTVEEGRHV